MVNEVLRPARMTSGYARDTVDFGERLLRASSSLLKNEEKHRVFLFLPESGLDAMVCERTLAYAASSLGIRIKL